MFTQRLATSYACGWIWLAALGWAGGEPPPGIFPAVFSRSSSPGGQFSVHWGEMWTAYSFPLKSSWNGNNGYPNSIDDPWFAIRTQGELRDSTQLKYADGATTGGYSITSLPPGTPNYFVPYLEETLLAVNQVGNTDFRHYENLLQHQQLELPGWDYHTLKDIALTYGFQYLWSGPNGTIYGKETNPTSPWYGMTVGKDYDTWFNVDPSSPLYWSNPHWFTFIDTIPTDSLGNHAPLVDGHPLIDDTYFCRPPGPTNFAELRSQGNGVHTRGIIVIAGHFNHAGSGNPPADDDIVAPDHLGGGPYLVAPDGSTAGGNVRVNHNGILFTFGQIRGTGNYTAYGSMISMLGFTGAGAREVYGNFRAATMLQEVIAEALEFDVSLESTAAAAEEDGGLFEIPVFAPRLEVAGGVSVQTVVTDGTALLGVDYFLPTTTTVVIPFGVNSGALEIEVLDNAVPQGDRSFQVEIVSTSRGRVGEPSLATVTILDDDDNVTSSIRSASITHPENGGLLKGPVDLDRAAAFPIHVGWALTPLTPAASPALDPATGTLTYEPGKISKDIALVPMDDLFRDGDEEYELAITFAHFDVGGSLVPLDQPEPPPALLTIVDNEADLSFESARTEVAEGTGQVSVPVILSAAYDLDIPLSITVVGGTAIEGLDYRLASVPAELSAGMTSVDVVVEVMDDYRLNGDVEFRMELGPAPYTIGVAPTSHDFVILDDDFPSVQLSYPLDTDPGWPRDGIWEFGVPQGMGGTLGVGADPGEAFTGANVFGTNLAGNYIHDFALAEWLTIGPLDFSQLSSTSLRFARWLAVEGSQFDSAVIEMQTTDAAWHPIFQNPVSLLADASWQQVVIETPAADFRPEVWFRFGIGPTDDSVAYGGWNLDDIEFWGTVDPNPTSLGPEHWMVH